MCVVNKIAPAQHVEGSVTVCARTPCISLQRPRIARSAAAGTDEDGLASPSDCLREAETGTQKHRRSQRKRITPPCQGPQMKGSAILLAGYQNQDTAVSSVSVASPPPLPPPALGQEAADSAEESLGLFCLMTFCISAFGLGRLWLVSHSRALLTPSVFNDSDLVRTQLFIKLSFTDSGF